MTPRQSGKKILPDIFFTKSDDTFKPLKNVGLKVPTVSRTKTTIQMFEEIPKLEYFELNKVGIVDVRPLY